MNPDKRIENIEALLEKLVAGQSFDSSVPLPMRDAALACHVELATLRIWVSHKKIPAYRNCPDGSWRVFPADIKAFLMSESNLKPARRVRVLKRA